ncbi:hypothetical protein C0Q70_15585 [Pomacea canaliculata]|uniref:Uncharacterized protein n=1 Tax=Pomacea canaliculata TaxID=400727 RepID=A0A2T7NV83_POMCA|nr:hypothetical protein C0Q70_15585 [Pomacea canaliculata]
MWTFLDNTVPKDNYVIWNRTDAKNVIILMTNGMMSNVEQTTILDVVDKGKKSMDRSVFHLVHVIKPLAGFTRYDVTVFRQLVERSNWTSARTSWQSSHRRPVEFAWWLKEIPDNVGFGFADKVAKFYTVFPPEDIFSSLDRILAVLLTWIKTQMCGWMCGWTELVGREDGLEQDDPYFCESLILTYAVQVFNDTLPKLYGVAAVEASMASMFSDVTSFQWGVHSYSFLVERDRGLVLVHPKLDIPSHKTATDPVFTTMDFLEPSFTPEQRAAILAANSSVMTFDTKMFRFEENYSSLRNIA